MSLTRKMIRVGLLLVMAVTLTSCEPNVYASVGYSSWGGYGGGGSSRMRGSVSVSGRVCC